MTIAERIEILNQAAGIVAKFREITDKANPVAVAVAIDELHDHPQVKKAESPVVEPIATGIRGAIITALRVSPGTLAEVISFTGEKRSSISATMCLMCQAGQVTHDGGKPRKYRLAK